MSRTLTSLTNAFPLWVVAMSAVALFHPAWFTWFSGPWIVWGLAIIMLGMGLTLTVDDFRSVGRMPRAVALGFVAQYTIMPFLGLPFWVGVAWRRANRYGAWVSAVGAALVYFGGAFLGWPVPLRSLVSLLFGLVTIVAVSLATRPEPQESLNKLFVSLHTPVGFEDRLVEAGAAAAKTEVAPG
jgi:hypothetical protein